jgi:excisionase family DNA binding protein
MSGLNQTPIFICGTKEIATALGLGINDVRRLVKSPGFPAVKHGIKWLTTKDDLERWAKTFMERNRTPDSG